MMWTNDNIGSAIAGREVARHMRGRGNSDERTSAAGKGERHKFLSALDTMITAAQRQKPKARR